MIAYKLFRIKSKGEITSLFINKTEHLPINKWLMSKSYRTKGFKFRPGWHCLEKPNAPHLSLKRRAWYKIKIKNIKTLKKPKNQGDKWFLAKYMKILEKL